jgi:hypothetical protein
MKAALEAYRSEMKLEELNAKRNKLRDVVTREFDKIRHELKHDLVYMFKSEIALIGLDIREKGFVYDFRIDKDWYSVRESKKGFGFLDVRTRLGLIMTFKPSQKVRINQCETAFVDQIFKHLAECKILYEKITDDFYSRLILHTYCLFNLYTSYPIAETKRSVRLILGCWRDSDLKCFPREIILMICKRALWACHPRDP